MDHNCYLCGKTNNNNTSFEWEGEILWICFCCRIESPENRDLTLYDVYDAYNRFKEGSKKNIEHKCPSCKLLNEWIDDGEEFEL